MAGKRGPGRFTWKEEREVIAMAASGATVLAIAEKFKTSSETIERKARQLGISLSEIRGERPKRKRRLVELRQKAKGK
jgi:hypothetical protein